MGAHVLFGRTYFHIDDDVTKSQIGVAADKIYRGDWVHVVAVRDTTDKMLKLYFDGVLQPSIDPSSHHYDGVDRTGSISNPRELFIGDASRRDNPFKGELDDIRIDRSPLSMHQVAALSKSLRPAMENAPAPIARSSSNPASIKQKMPAQSPGPLPPRRSCALAAREGHWLNSQRAGRRSSRRVAKSQPRDRFDSRQSR